jgi:hypothetical protein
LEIPQDGRRGIPGSSRRISEDLVLSSGASGPGSPFSVIFYTGADERV